MSVNSKREGHKPRVSGLEAKRGNIKNPQARLNVAEKLAEILKAEKGIEIDSDLIELANSIKQIGTFEVPVRVGEKLSKFTLEVIR